MVKRKDIIPGEKFGRLTVLHETDAISYDGGYRFRNRVIAQCECGTTKPYIMASLRCGNTTSCGCVKRERADRTKHGQGGNTTRSGAYRTWKAMKQRCADPNSIGWDHYGGRGIKVCGRWLNSFENFYADMGDRPKGMTLDRERSDEDYGPENCKWATHAEQSNNRRCTIFIEHQGKRLTMPQWSSELGLSLNKIRDRRKKGWPPEKILAI